VQKKIIRNPGSSVTCYRSAAVLEQFIFRRESTGTGHDPLNDYAVTAMMLK
jgi:hypothetical protein